MPNALVLQTHSTLVEPDVLRIQRLLPGPASRIFAYLTDSDLRRQWLAAGEMPSDVGTPFTLTWRNDELTGESGQRPDGFPEEHSMDSRLLEIEPPTHLAFAWGEHGKIIIDLEDQGENVLLTLTHQRLPADRKVRTNISAGWHSHLDILQAIMTGNAPEPFWPHWQALRADYEERLPA